MPNSKKMIKRVLHDETKKLGLSRQEQHILLAEFVIDTVEQNISSIEELQSFDFQNILPAYLEAYTKENRNFAPKRTRRTMCCSKYPGLFPLCIRSC